MNVYCVCAIIPSHLSLSNWCTRVWFRVGYPGTLFECPYYTGASDWFVLYEKIGACVNVASDDLQCLMLLPDKSVSWLGSVCEWKYSYSRVHNSYTNKMLSAIQRFKLFKKYIILYNMNNINKVSIHITEPIRIYSINYTYKTFGGRERNWNLTL